MQRIVVGLIMAAVLGFVGFFAAPRATAQAPSSCPAGFTLAKTGGDDPEDVDRDGYVCQQLTAQSATLVFAFKVDNSGYPCPGSSSGTLFEPNGPFVPVQPYPIGVAPDRNCNAMVCAKQFFTPSGGFHSVLIDDKGPRGVCP
jgi:hypothetical protein